MLKTGLSFRTPSRKLAIATALVAIFAAVPAVAAPTGKVAVDENLRPYVKSSGVTGSLSSVGSDTLNNLMTLWSEKFSNVYPNVKVQIEGKGSSTAPPALISGTAQLGPMSRQMKPSEIDKFEAQYGYKPTEVKVAVDALAVFVHKDNPIEGLSMEQVRAIFSRDGTLNGKAIKTWGDVGLTGEWASKPLSLYGRNSASGTYGFFKEVALSKNDFKNTVKEQPGSASVVQSVSTDRYGIGYSGIGYQTSGVRALPLQGEASEGYVEATSENAYEGSYPLARFLYLYINKQPDDSMEPLIREFVRLILSKEGQEVVVKDGYYPITASIAGEELEKLQ